MITRPMLAVAAEDLEKIVFPVLCSPKLDGIRALKIDGKILSRSFKHIPNLYIRSVVESRLPDGVDGELLVGNTFHESSSGVMTQDGKPDFKYAIFDYVVDNLRKPYVDRLKDLYALLASINDKHFCTVPQVFAHSVQELVLFEQKFIDEGYEGLMLRSLDSPYKCGRSTAKEGFLLKMKRFEDSEALILGYEEQMHNTNEAKKDAFGKTERSQAKDGLVPKGVLGTLLVKDTKTGIEFKIGTGFDDDQRLKMWINRTTLPGLLVKYKYQPSGVKEAPRFPTFLSFRHPDDT